MAFVERLKASLPAPTSDRQKLDTEPEQRRGEYFSCSSLLPQNLRCFSKNPRCWLYSAAAAAGGRARTQRHTYVVYVHMYGKKRNWTKARDKR